MSANELPPDAPAPRLCHLIKWPDFDGYGFNLHAEKAKAGQYIGKVDEDSPAEFAGLREGDCIVEVNGVNIANENHKQVVERIKAVPNETKLLVVDEEGKKWYKERKLVVKSTQHNVIYKKTPIPRTSKHGDVNGNEQREINGDANHVTDSPNAEIEKLSNGVKALQAEEVVEKPNDIPPREETPPIARTGDVHSAQESKYSLAEERNKEEVGSSRSSTPQSLPKSENLASGGSNGSIPDSPQSTKSSHSQSNGPKSPASNGGGGGDLNLNMSASEMRQLLAARKKHDPKKIQMDLRKKYDIIQQM